MTFLSVLPFEIIYTCRFVDEEWCPTHILFCISLSCVPYVASSSGLSFFDCPFGIFYRLFNVISLILDHG